MEGVRRDGGQDQCCAVFVSRGCRYQVTVSFRLPPVQPSPLSWTIKQHACVRGGRVTGRLNALWSSCVMRSVNSWWTCTCSDARNIGRYNSSRYHSIQNTQYRFQYYTDPIIIRFLVIIIIIIIVWIVSITAVQEWHCERPPWNTGISVSVRWWYMSTCELMKTGDNMCSVKC